MGLINIKAKQCVTEHSDIGAQGRLNCGHGGRPHNAMVGWIRSRITDGSRFLSHVTSYDLWDPLSVRSQHIDFRL
jgi:hypothetical protein